MGKKWKVKFPDIPSPNNAVQIEMNTISNVSDHILFIF